MYTNIDSDHALETIEKWFTNFANELPIDYPTSLILKTLDIVMHNNIFQFGDTWWRQNIGTAMGTSCACIYSTIYYAYHERTLLLKKYNKNLIYYKRFIDDIFLIWQPTTTNNSNNTWEQFNSDLPFGKLTWAPSTFGTTAIFLDLEIKICNQQLHTKTYQKPLNLYLYLPPNSSHPPSTLKSLIFGNLRRFWIQCSCPDDYSRLTQEFFMHLLKRGHARKTLTALFKECALSLDGASSNNKKKCIVKNTLFNEHTMLYHTVYHLHNIPRLAIQQAYQTTCNNLPFTDNLIICYHRPRNIRDILIPSRLHVTKSYGNPSDYLHTYRV